MLNHIRKVIAICGVCWRAWDRETADDPIGQQWIPLDVLVAKMGLDTDDYLLSDGYCPECMAALLLESSVRVGDPQSPRPSAQLPSQ